MKSDYAIDPDESIHCEKKRMKTTSAKFIVPIERLELRLVLAVVVAVTPVWSSSLGLRTVDDQISSAHMQGQGLTLSGKPCWSCPELPSA
jgi:hypothetical protein